jgi:hypothetical protein
MFVTLCVSKTPAISQESWKSPEYKAEPYRKVLVLAKVSDETARRQLEDKTVNLLNDKGIKAIAAYANVTDSDFSSEDVFMTRMDALEVDGLIAYEVKGTNTEYKNSPSVGVNVGVPVRIGIFSGYVGTRVPLAGGTKSEQKVNVNASFYNRSTKAMQWSLPLSGVLKNDPGKLAGVFSITTVNGLMKDKIFLQ